MPEGKNYLSGVKNENLVKDKVNNRIYEKSIDEHEGMKEKMKAKIIAFINEPAYEPMKLSEMRYFFAVPKEKKAEFDKLIEELESDGEVYLSQKGKLLTPRSAGYLVGTFEGNRKGFGFVTDSNAKEEKDSKVFISKELKSSALDGDLVLVLKLKPAEGDKSPEGMVSKILKRGNKRIIGTFEKKDTFGFVKPISKKIDKDIFIPGNQINGAKNNDRVICEIVTFANTKDKNPEGKIVQIIGKKGERYVEIDSIVLEHNLPNNFPGELEEELNKVPDIVEEKDIKGRLDLRTELIYTIDGDDSKDFDDAISIEKLENDNYYLGVHIADVSHYIKEKSKLDKEALKRATSVYLVDKVIPMLPKKLSNGICSLNPGVDRLALSVFMEMNSNGQVVRYDIKETVINSKARMTYHDVSEILENNDKALLAKYEKFIESFKLGQELALILKKKRIKRGSIEFDFDESKIILNEDGTVKGIEPYERRISNKMIEEFMLVTNETIAEHFFWLEAPFVYRVHEEPESEKMLKLKNFLNALDYRLKYNGDTIYPKVLQEVIDRTGDKPEKQIISSVMLRSLRQARYSTICEGHFGLAAKYYCHFTSPIRRYPDLQIHRIIKESISSGISLDRKKHYEHIVSHVADQSSIQERKAELAERDVEDYYKAVYMEDRIGQEFEGNISHITSFGIYVELDNSVEGMVRLTDLDDYYEFFENSFSLVGQNTKKIFRIGDRLKIRVAKVKVDLREIDFEIIEKLDF